MRGPRDIAIVLPEDDPLVHAWRAEQLAKLGVSRRIARAMAPFVDWHEVARLVERGCAPDLAIEILR